MSRVECVESRRGRTLTEYCTNRQDDAEYQSENYEGIIWSNSVTLPFNVRRVIDELGRCICSPQPNVRICVLTKTRSDTNTSASTGPMIVMAMLRSCSQFEGSSLPVPNPALACAPVAWLDNVLSSGILSRSQSGLPSVEKECVTTSERLFKICFIKAAKAFFFKEKKRERKRK